MEKQDFDLLLREETVEKKDIFEGRVLHLFCDTVKTANGILSTREYALHRGAVATLALDESENVYLVRQYRYPIGRSTVEIPAGKLEVGESDTEAAARRELSEEIGATAKKMTPIGVYMPSPATCTERIYCYLAEGLSFGETHPDEDENLLTLKMPLAEALALVLNGSLEDGKTLFALQKVFLLKHPIK